MFVPAMVESPKKAVSLPRFPAPVMFWVDEKEMPFPSRSVAPDASEKPVVAVLLLLRRSNVPPVTDVRPE